MPDTLVTLLESAAAGPGGITFVGGETAPWRDVLSRARKTAGQLENLGVAPGDHVAVMLPNSAEFVDVFFGAVVAGAIPLPITVDYRGPMLARVMEVAEPKLVVVGSNADIPAELVGRPAISMSELRRLPGDASAGRALPRPDDAAVLMLTSGTTSGRSKVVVYSHRSALQFAAATVRCMPYEPGDVIYTCLPLVHGAALMCDLFGSLMSGASIVVAERFSASRYWDEIVAHRATVASTLGTITQILVQAPVSDKERRHRLRVVRRSGVTAELTREFEDRFAVRTTEMYGLTDVGLITGLPAGVRRLGSCGSLFDEWEAELRDPSGLVVQDGDAGQLFVRPAGAGTLPLGYLDDQPSFGAALVDGWFQTGDVLVRDSDGFYAFVGRVKDVIRRAGENIAPADVEYILVQHPDVAEVAVYAVPSHLGEDEVMAAVVLKRGVLDAPTLRAFCADRLPYFSVPRYYRALPRLPRTVTQKVQVQTLRSWGISPDTVDTGSTSRSAMRKAEQ
ncbi:ATP-dependent acyl-CoA ligase [Acrocarpospora macrocephala]|uniref:ATP-dependent acyl-CoA ligase n=1 Tax=Acrocarpospora macrocephala TaxID=150177 RepID=A0A5M3X2L8_9ACTN|nr:AMP-binding protein [Acrocarpospora macrocephala]GES15290.1 ATP-dependent acyl-CoA ligase [Acrocarpospora macrocephala]